MDPSILAQATEQLTNPVSMLSSISDVGFETLGGVLGAGMIVIGAGKGIGNLAGKALEAISRQPEAGGRIFTTMVVAAALIEGFTFFALVIALLAVAFQGGVHCCDGGVEALRNIADVRGMEQQRPNC